jgi:hypothetical protein
MDTMDGGLEASTTRRLRRWNFIIGGFRFVLSSMGDVRLVEDWSASSLRRKLENF